jgi:L-aminopeptidase/D-esterase-like protein
MSSAHALALVTPQGLSRARALGLAFQGEPGPNNGITDVVGVEVGYHTMIRGDGPLVVGAGPVRTGVTAIHPRGRAGAGIPVFAGVHSLNGNGEMTGFVWIEECGRTELPIVLTNTHSVGVARDAVIKWMLRTYPSRSGLFALPVAAETFDGMLNDINGFHVSDNDVFAALDNATAGVIDEGSVGGGTGMICYEFKGGSGTSSRVVSLKDATGDVVSQGVVGAFVQSNFGRRELLSIGGVPVGRALPVSDWPIGTPPATTATSTPTTPTFGAQKGQQLPGDEQGSIIVVVATDLPLMPHQLKRLARRAGLGVGRSGSIAGHGSGDIFLAFSTANTSFFAPGAAPRSLDAVPDDALSPVFHGVIQAVDEAIINSMVANRTMTGINGFTVPALPHDEVVRLCCGKG